MTPVTDPEPASPTRPRWRDWLVAPMRHPGRMLAGVGVAVLLGGVLAFAGGWAWVEWNLRQARRAVAAGHNLEAVHYLERCRSLDRDHPKVLLLSARVARRTGSMDLAQDQLDRYWAKRGDDDDLVLERLLLRASRGEVDELTPVFLKRIDAGDPAAELLLEALVIGCLQQFRLGEAAGFLKLWQRRHPDGVAAVWLEGRLHDQNDKPGDALACYRQVLEDDPAHDEARLRLAEGLVQLSQGEEALGHLDYLRHRIGYHPEVEVLRARSLLLLGRTDEAGGVLDDLLKRDPDHPTALAERGVLARRAGDGELAEAMLRKAVVRDAGNAHTRFQLFQTLVYNKKPEEARQEEARFKQLEDDLKRMRALINSQMKQTPTDPEVYYEVAMIALRSGLPRETLRWLQAGLRVDPDHLPTHRALATWYQKMGNPVLSARHRSLAQRLSQTRDKP